MVKLKSRAEQLEKLDKFVGDFSKQNSNQILQTLYKHTQDSYIEEYNDDNILQLKETLNNENNLNENNLTNDALTSGPESIMGNTN